MAGVLRGVDHIAIVVRDTDAALAFYRDTLGFPVVLSEVVNDPPVRLTHLDLGNVQLQLVQPIGADHPLLSDLEQHGERLHHLCFKVDNVPAAVETLREAGLPPRSPTPHSGPRGRRASFLHPQHTRGVLFEITNEPPAEGHEA